MSTAELLDGVTVKIGRKNYVVPPLNFKLLRKFKDDIKALTAPTTAGEFENEDRIVKIAHAAIKRNYPDVTLEEIEDGLDMRNAPAVMRAILNASGFEQTGEAKAPPASADQSTGEPTTSGTGSMGS